MNLHPRARNLLGQRFGKLTVVALATEQPGPHLWWDCRCDCGNMKSTNSHRLTRKATRSCGCLRVEAMRTLRPGMRYGRLVVQEYVGPSRWLCNCDCGGSTVALTTNLNRGGSRSCGCARYAVHTTHGRSKTREYRIWSAMRDRCSNPSRRSFKHYGGRGIRVCDRWQSFDNFLADMGPSNGLTLDRVDNSRGYSPDNCRWADMKTQARNKRSARDVAVQSLSVAELQRLLLEHTLFE